MTFIPTQEGYILGGNRSSSSLCPFTGQANPAMPNE
jgi:hypothetical protein